jgi:hypothetical protein
MRWAIVLACASVLLGGCGLLDGRPPAGVVGDSITLQVVEELREVAGDDWRLDIRPMPGATVGEMLAAVDAAAQRNPDQVIINLGTNDVLRDVAPETSAGHLASMFELLAGVPCVHVVTVHEYIFSWEEGYLTDRAVAYNTSLREAANVHGAQVIDWTAVVTAAREPPDAPDLFTDTVHITPAGIDLLAGVYDNVLATGCP